MCHTTDSDTITISAFVHMIKMKPLLMFRCPDLPAFPYDHLILNTGWFPVYTPKETPSQQPFSNLCSRTDETCQGPTEERPEQALIRAGEPRKVVRKGACSNLRGARRRCGRAAGTRPIHQSRMKMST